DKDKLGNLLPNEAIEAAAKVSKQLKAFRDVIDRSWRPDPSAQEPMWRAPNGRLPEIWMPDIEAIADDTRALFNWAHAALTQVAKGKPEDAARERLQR
ncbi:MAG TPA: ATP-dependent DNA helicase DinG, partial [Stenotrophomonas sp.]|nr:ATP-dependent DNA helicase DinG [Stenotrophomonas sp.]